MFLAIFCFAQVMVILLYFDEFNISCGFSSLVLNQTRELDK